MVAEPNRQSLAEITGLQEPETRNQAVTKSIAALVTGRLAEYVVNGRKNVIWQVWHVLRSEFILLCVSNILMLLSRESNWPKGKSTRLGLPVITLKNRFMWLYTAVLIIVILAPTMWIIAAMREWKHSDTHPLQETKVTEVIGYTIWEDSRRISEDSVYKLYPEA